MTTTDNPTAPTNFEWASENMALRRRRGHAFYPAPAVLAAVPQLYATEAIDVEQKIIHLHYFVGGSDWWVAELDPRTGEAFGFARVGGYEPGEWGSFALPELEQIAVVAGGLPMVVERDLDWTPRPFERRFTS